MSNPLKHFWASAQEISELRLTKNLVAKIVLIARGEDHVTDISQNDLDTIAWSLEVLAAENQYLKESK